MIKNILVNNNKKKKKETKQVKVVSVASKNKKNTERYTSKNNSNTNKPRIVPKTSVNCNQNNLVIQSQQSSYQKIIATLEDDAINTECSQEARLLFEKSRYGILLDDGRVQLTLIEGYYLLQKEKIIVYQKNKVITKQELQSYGIKKEKNFWIRYVTYADFRNRGYVIKTALKFGADFRVYDKGVLPGQDHARWIVFPVKETDHLTWYNFAAKNRVAHSTKKRLLLAICDEENSVTYYEVKWTRP